ncbi:hypothetical protein PG2006B_0010 [Bifidobacterium animalis subsp. animalis]|uniref:DUF4234 domain-containing protein n=1 Tax=Bifidobacterium animalis TaxID=28025 RepID=UPI0010D44C6F|nr:hypothetical protein PG2022B_0069 [Bifidobacterium animalis subsp. animalis]RYN15395.1 hypothetical protein PG2006B_0010 [Bifidobacterium animalis subsp. animalis]
MTYPTQPNQNPAFPQQSPVYAAPAPIYQLPTNRSLAKFILLGIITFGIYPIVIMTTSAEDLNIIASRYDGKKTMNYCLMFFLIGWLTLGIGWLVWHNNFSARIGNEQRRRGMAPTVTAATYWLWAVLGSLIVVGPFIYYYKVLRAMNELCAAYNATGC